MKCSHALTREKKLKLCKNIPSISTLEAKGDLKMAWFRLKLRGSEFGVGKGLNFENGWTYHGEGILQTGLPGLVS